MRHEGGGRQAASRVSCLGAWMNDRATRHKGKETRFGSGPVEGERGGYLEGDFTRKDSHQERGVVDFIPL